MTEAPLFEKTGMSLSDYVEQYDKVSPFEILEGEIVYMSPTLFGHNQVSKTIYDALFAFTRPDQLGEVYTETPFILPDADRKNWVKGSRVPDVMFIQTERLKHYIETTENWRTSPLALVPDLAVEVVSLGDRYTDINRKVEIYLEDGVRLVWIVDPQRKAVSVSQQGSNQQIHLDQKAILTGYEVLPNFKLKIADLFD